MTIPRGTPILVASHNAGKVREIADLLAPYGLSVRGAAELGLPEPDETGTTFADNAMLKARAAAGASGILSLADDSGLSVRALGGAPGIYSARWAGPERNFDAAMARLERELHGITDRSAKFVCVLAMAEPSGKTEAYEGEVHGRLVFPPRGKNGFGYDPVFVADGMDATFGEIEPARKHAISHRARAFAEFARRTLEP